MQPTGHPADANRSLRRDEIGPAVLESFPFLRAEPPAQLARLWSVSSTMSAPAGTMLTRPGDACEGSALVISGELRVSSISASGRRLTLYSVLPGQLCALSTMCLLTGQPFPAFIDAAVDTTLVVVPPATFTELVHTSEAWRRMAFRSGWERFDDLLTLIDDVVFTDLPTRLAGALLTESESGVVRLTHAELGEAVGSSREAVSRLLKQWEHSGLVALSRGRVELRDLPGLRRLGGR